MLSICIVDPPSFQTGCKHTPTIHFIVWDKIEKRERSVFPTDSSPTFGAVQLLRNALGGGGGGGHGVTLCDRGRGVGRALRNA